MILQHLFFRTLMPLILVAPMVACSNNPEPGLPADKMTAQINSYNHTEDYVHKFYVDGTWGGNSFAYGGGGGFVCCVIYPRRWVPGLVARVRWTTSSSDPDATGDAATEKWHEKTVPIEKYSEPGAWLSVHFLPRGEVRLIISSVVAGHPDYRGPPAPVKPKEFRFQRD